MTVSVLCVMYEADVECDVCGSQWIESGSGDPLEESFDCPFCEEEDA